MLLGAYLVIWKFSFLKLGSEKIIKSMLVFDDKKLINLIFWCLTWKKLLVYVYYYFHILNFSTQFS